MSWYCYLRLAEMIDKTTVFLASLQEAKEIEYDDREWNE